MICFQGKNKKKRFNYVSVLAIFFKKTKIFFEGVIYKVCLTDYFFNLFFCNRQRFSDIFNRNLQRIKHFNRFS